MSALRYYTSLVIMAAASFIATAQSVSIEAPAPSFKAIVSASQSLSTIAMP